MSDTEILLLSWAQLAAVLALIPGHDEYASAIEDVAAKLENHFSITNLQLLARSFNGYTIAYKEAGTMKTATFPSEDVEEFM